MIKKNFLVKAVCLLFLLALPSYASACRCPGSISPASAYKRADVVLWGKVLDVKGNIDKEGATAKISVLKAWKKGVRNEVDVFTSTTCAYVFQTGDEYLLYLSKSPDGKNYTTKKCVGNLPIPKAKKALDWLNRHGAPMDIGQ